MTRSRDHPEVDGHPILRIAHLHADRVPVTHQSVEGVPDEVLGAFYEAQIEGSQRMELADLVASYGGTLHEDISRATSLAMTRAPEGGYRVYEIDAAGERTGFDPWYETLEVAIRMCALTYGFPPGTLTWKEVPGNWT